MNAKQEKDIRVFVVSHKEVPLPNCEPFVPIQVGSGPAIPSIKCRDNTGDNIAEKNPNYCELTAQYWIWKNVKADYVGLCHYRRIPSFTSATDPLFWSFDDATRRRFGWDKETIAGLLTKYDILLPPAWPVFPPGEPGNLMTPYQFHAYEHRESDIAETLRVIYDVTPNVYNYAHKALCVDTVQCFGNICIMRKELFDAYSEWLFKVLFELERRIEIPEDKEQARVFGYLSERLIMAWLRYAEDQLGARPWFATAVPLGCFPEPRLADTVCVAPRQAVDHPLLSVIIPVYNVEKYLIRCLNSVCGQSEERIEIICVNDGSTDGSLDILNAFAEKDKRIRIITKKNAGLGAARNTGIDAAKGKYLAFVDSDDWVDRFIWFRSLRKMERFDLEMLFFEPQDVEDETGWYLSNPWNCLRLPQKCYRASYTWREMGRTPFDSCCYAHNRIIRRSFWGNRRFPEGVLYEDAVIHFDLLFSAKRIGAIACAFYFYRIRKNSLMSVSDARVLDHLILLDGVHQVLEEKKIAEELQKPFLTYAIHILAKTYQMSPCKVVYDALKAFVSDPKRANWNWQTCPIAMRPLLNAVRSGQEHRLRKLLGSQANVSEEGDIFEAVAFVGWSFRLSKAAKYVFVALCPYGIVVSWKQKRYGIQEDLPLWAYPPLSKKLRRVVKFALPYGVISIWKRRTAN